ncbi:MAG: hypothetical protein PIR02_01525 [Microbacterium enclense]
MRNTAITPTIRKIVCVTTATVVAGLTLFPLGAASATAADVAPAGDSGEASAFGLTVDQVRQAHADFQTAGVPFDVVRSEGRVVNVYHFPEGDLGLVVPPQAGAAIPALAVGSDGEGQYISLNHTDQVALKTGATSALAIAIGVLNPDVGLAVGALLNMANIYVGNNGMCSGNDELWVYYNDGPTGPSYSQVICRPVSYRGGG